MGYPLNRVLQFSAQDNPSWYPPCLPHDNSISSCRCTLFCAHSFSLSYSFSCNCCCIDSHLPTFPTLIQATIMQYVTSFLSPSCSVTNSCHTDTNYFLPSAPLPPTHSFFQTDSTLKSLPLFALIEMCPFLHTAVIQGDR